MSIESGSTATSHKLFGAIDPRAGKRAGKADAAADASNNFSMLMGMLAAAEDATSATTSIEQSGDAVAGFVLSNALADPVAYDNNGPLAQSKYALEAMNSEASTALVDVAQPLLPVSTGNLAGLKLDAKGGFQTTNAVAMAQPSTWAISSSTDLEGKSPLDQSESALEAINLNNPLVPQGLGTVLAGPSLGEAAVMLPERNSGLPTIKSGSAPVAAGPAADKLVRNEAVGGVVGDRGLAAMPIGTGGQGVVAQTEVRVVGHGPTSVQNLSAAQADMKESRTHVSTVDMAARSEVGSTLTLLNGTARDLVPILERGSTKSSGVRFGDASADNFGIASGVNSRADAPYEIEATAAAVPDTAIAETVSYWVAQGVQSAELTLDGFGGDPVEVRISLNGDQAQVDFRTDQTDVRQALEAATAELRELLSGEGLQLVGVSVGASGGRNSQGEAKQPSPGEKPVEILPKQVTSTARSRSSDPTVGRSLDLFV